MIQAVGVIIAMRKIITKTGKSMAFIQCEGFDYTFEAVIFSKDFEKYQADLIQGRIIIATGSLSVSKEYGRKSLQVQELKIGTIGQIRKQADSLGLLHDTKRKE